MADEIKQEMDTDKLIEMLKNEGLEMAEDTLAKAYKCCSEWAVTECPKHENGVVKMLPALLLALDPVVKSYIDKIDGKEG